MLISLMMAGAALAQDCDVRAMSKDILAAGPHEAAPMFVQLAQCDGAAAAISRPPGRRINVDTHGRVGECLCEWGLGSCGGHNCVHLFL